MGRRSDPFWRDHAAADLVLSVLSDVVPEGRVLVADDSGETVAHGAVSRRLVVERWRRFDHEEAHGTPWPYPPGEGPWAPAGSRAVHGVQPADEHPADGPVLCDAALIRLPRSREAFDFTLAACLTRLRPGARVLVYGAKDEGIVSTARRMEEVLKKVYTEANAKRCRVQVGTAVATGSSTLAGWRSEEEVEIAGERRPWVSYPGTFAKGGIDAGTALLLEHLPAPGELPAAPGDGPGGSGAVGHAGAVVDFAAGTGVVAAALRRVHPSSPVVMVEPDAVARAAARENVPGADFLHPPYWQSEGPYRAIVSNPPYHAGKEETLDVIEELIWKAEEALLPGGELRIVVQRRLPVEAILRDGFHHVEVVADGGPYRIWRAREPRG